MATENIWSAQRAAEMFWEARKAGPRALCGQDAVELEWWRQFALAVEPGGDMPEVGSMLLGWRFSVRMVEV